MKSFKQAFESFCKKNSIKKNSEQLDLVEKFEEFNALIQNDKTLIKKLFSKSPDKRFIIFPNGFLSINLINEECNIRKVTILLIIFDIS